MDIKQCTNESAKNHNLPLYQKIRETGGFTNWDMILIENYPCASKHELHARERELVEDLHANLNIVVPGRTIEQYYNDNRAQIQETDRKRYQAKKEIISEKMRVKMMCECGSEFRRSAKARHYKTEKHQQFILPDAEN